MRCPRCGNEWDASKSPCTRCGLLVDAPNSSASSSAKTNAIRQVRSGPQIELTQSEVAGPNALHSRIILSRQSTDATIPRIPATPHPLQITDATIPRVPTASHIDQGVPDVQYSWRPSGRVTAALPKNTRPIQRLPSQEDVSIVPGIYPLVPGTLLRGGRYLLQEPQERQEWLQAAYEATWVARDAQRAGAKVMICELVLPQSDSMMAQSLLRVATMALASIGRHPRISTLWDAFSEQGRNFFVFESIQGESLLARMRRTGRALSEQEVIECCLQMTEVLEVLAQQSPPLLHGFICPQHIILAGAGLQYMLTNFSLVLAGGATQFVSGIDSSWLSPYAAPELAQGIVDVRSDLYALLATAYYAVTGSVPIAVNGVVPQAQHLNLRVSPKLNTILAKGVRAIPDQRYQHPAELRHDLLSMHSLDVGLSSMNAMRADARSARSLQLVQNTANAVAQILPTMLLPVVDDMDKQERQLLPACAEELPPLKEGNDVRDALLWLVTMLASVIAVIVLSRGLV